MKYTMRVDVNISQHESGSYNPLRLTEESIIELSSLSDAAMILVKLHDFFEALRKARA